MIIPRFEEAFSKEWRQTQMTDLSHELVILRQVIPWQAMSTPLIQFYDCTKGRVGTSLRILVALLILDGESRLHDELCLFFSFLVQKRLKRIATMRVIEVKEIFSDV